MKKSLSSIRYYFAVDQTYVIKKLCLLLFPFRSRVKYLIKSFLNQTFFFIELVTWL